MYKSLVILLWAIPFLVSAQKATISARVIDKESKEALAFATVGIKGKPIGTITNLQGEFDFHFPSEYSNETLAISILGYVSFESLVSELINRENLVIELERTTFMLKEVVVIDSLNGGEILHVALTRMEQNYPDKPFLLDGFYRDIKKVEGAYISLLEAATKIYDEDYSLLRNKNKLRERVALLEIRRSIGYSNKFTAYFDQTNLLEDLLIHNDIRYRQFPEEDIFFETLKRKNDEIVDGREVYVIGIDTVYHLKIIIDKKTFGMLHLEFEAELSDTMRKMRGLYSKLAYVKRVLDYKFYDGRLFPNYMTMVSRINWYDIRTDELRFETELDQSLLINDINADPDGRIGTTEKMRKYGLQYQDLPYNKEFWDNYNVIKESPLDKKIVEDLEKLGPLEKQFEENN